MWDDKNIFQWIETAAYIAIVVFAVAILFNGCTQPQAPAPIVQEACKSGKWCLEYTDLIKQSITPAMLKADTKAICPKNISNEKFWVALGKAISRAESDWKPEETYTETTQGIDRVTGKQSESEGLFQISYKDSIHDYYKTTACKEISWPKKNIRDPKINISCAYAIFNVLLTRNGGDVGALKNYWATMRPNEDRYKKVTLPTFKAEMPECF